MGEVDHHDEWRWPRPYCSDAELIGRGGGLAAVPVTTPTGTGWSLTNSPNLTPPGYYYLVAVDSRDVPSQAKIIKVT